MIKRLICKIFGHRWFYYEDESGLIPVIYGICERCYKSSIGFPPPKTFNCRCSLMPYEFKNTHVLDMAL